MQVFSAAPHHEIMALLLQIAVLLLAARTLGELAQRAGQPSVVGEILAGILIGPSCLGHFFPSLTGILIPGTPLQGHLLEVISLVGAMLLLLVTGLETDLSLIRRHARTALGVSAGGILVTFSSGFALGQLIPADLLADPGQRLIFSLFMATAMSISAIPVIAKVLLDMKLMRRDIGQTILAAGMSDDTVGWIMLSIVAGMASGSAVGFSTVAFAVGKVFFFMIFSFTAGLWFVKKILDFIQDRASSRDRLLSAAIILTFLWGAFTQALHLEPVLGAFVMGILLGQVRRLPRAVPHQIETVAMGIFAPVFFAVAGLKVNILSLLQPKLFAAAVIVILIATAGKVSGTYLGARLIGRRDHWTSLAFGAALNARGAMEIIIATIGLSLGILSPDMFSIVVVMAMVTSLMAPTALRFILKRIKPGDEELKRLQREALSKGSPISHIHRVLIPVRRWENADKTNQLHNFKFLLLKKLASQTPLSITYLSSVKKEDRAQARMFLESLPSIPGHELVRKIVESQNPADSILDESQKDYDLLILGSSEKSGQSANESVFSSVIDSLVRLNPGMTLVVNPKNADADWRPQKILVPTNGSLAAKRAAEFAFLLASGENEVTILNIVVQEPGDWDPDIHSGAFKRQIRIAEHTVEELKTMGESHGIPTSAEVKVAVSSETAVLELAENEKFDLIILGTDVRPASERLFLGPRVEKILKNAPCPVLVLNAV